MALKIFIFYHSSSKMWFGVNKYSVIERIKKKRLYLRVLIKLFLYLEKIVKFIFILDFIFLFSLGQAVYSNII